MSAADHRRLQGHLHVLQLPIGQIHLRSRFPGPLRLHLVRPHQINAGREAAAQGLRRRSSKLHSRKSGLPIVSSTSFCSESNEISR